MWRCVVRHPEPDLLPFAAELLCVCERINVSGRRDCAQVQCGGELYGTQRLLHHELRRRRLIELQADVRRRRSSDVRSRSVEGRLSGRQRRMRKHRPRWRRSWLARNVWRVQLTRPCLPSHGQKGTPPCSSTALTRRTARPCRSLHQAAGRTRTKGVESAGNRTTSKRKARASRMRHALGVGLHGLRAGRVVLQWKVEDWEPLPSLATCGSKGPGSTG